MARDYFGDSRERTLQGGPLDGETMVWGTHARLEVAFDCPTAALRVDTAIYDRDGVYLHSTHNEPGPLRSFEDCCSLCPGHYVGAGSSTDFQHGDHPDVQEAA